MLTEINTVLATIDQNLRGPEGLNLYWRSESKRQGYNIGLVDLELSPKNINVIEVIVKETDRLSKNYLETNGYYSGLRLDRIDLMLDERGEIFMLERNPGWVDNIAFASVLTENASVMEEICNTLKNESIQEVDLAWVEQTSAGRYEQSFMCEYMQTIDPNLKVEAKPLEEVSYTGSKKAVILSAPFSRLSNEQLRIIADLEANTELLILPNKGMVEMEDNSWLLNQSLPTPPTIQGPESLEVFEEALNQGYSVLKMDKGSSTKGVTIVDGQFSVIDLFEKYSQGPFIMQQNIKPKRINMGIGLDYMRAKGKPMQPDEVDLSQRAIKINIWVCNGKFIALGCASRDDGSLIADSGFNFKFKNL